MVKRLPPQHLDACPEIPWIGHDAQTLGRRLVCHVGLHNNQRSTKQTLNNIRSLRDSNSAVAHRQLDIMRKRVERMRTRIRRGCGDNGEREDKAQEVGIIRGGEMSDNPIRAGK
jgi:hypothetical protein